MGVQRGTQAGCGTNVPAGGWLAAALVCEETITKLNEDIKDGGPFPARCEQNARLSEVALFSALARVVWQR